MRRYGKVLMMRSVSLGHTYVSPVEALMCSSVKSGNGTDKEGERRRVCVQACMHASVGEGEALRLSAILFYLPVIDNFQ